MFASDLPQPGAEQEGQRAPQIKRKTAGETERQSRSQIKHALLWGQRARARYKSKPAPMAGQRGKQITPISSAACPCGGGEKKDASLLLTLKRQNERDSE